MGCDLGGRGAVGDLQNWYMCWIVSKGFLYYNYLIIMVYNVL